MGAIITRREYTNEFRNETTSWLLGNVGDRITLELDVEVEISFTSSNSETITSNGSNQFTRSTGSFLKDGFFVGSNFNLLTAEAGIPVAMIGVVTVLTPTLMRFSVSSGTVPGLGQYPFTDGTTTNNAMLIFSNDNVQGINFNYNLLANSNISSGSLNSLIDGTTPTFYGIGISPTNTTTPVVLESVGFNSGHSVFNVQIVGLGKVNYTQKFKISVDFQIIPLFDTVSNFETNVAPSFLFDSESLTDVFEMTFEPQVNNPNVILRTENTQTGILGSVGWFDENFNGKETDYSVVGVQYSTTNGINVSKILKDAPTNFQITLNQTGASVNSKYRIGFINVPFDKSLISNNDKTNYENILLNDLNSKVHQGTNQFTFAGYGNTSGAKMGIRFDSITNSGSTVYISGQFQPNNVFNTYFNSIDESNWNYLFYVSLADSNLASNVSDRTSLIVDFAKLSELPLTFVSGDATIQILNHAQGITNVGSANYLGTVEDEILTKTLFYLDTAKSESIDTIRFKVEGFDTNTGSTFNCENYEIDTSVFPLDTNGVQLFDVDTTRGFQMTTGVDKNFVKIVREQTEDIGTKKAFYFYYALRPRWEYWIENTSVPDELIDGTKRFDGKNQNWARLDSVFNYWKLRFSVETKLNSNSEVVNTKNSSNLYINTFEESTIWDGSINHYDQTKSVNLFTGLNTEGIRTNAILETEPTLIEADFDLEDVAGDVGNISNYYGVIRIEVFEQGGIKGIEMISTILDNVNGILKPVTGSTKCKIEKISATKIRLSALIDNNLLNITGVGYKTSARIGFSNLSTPGIYGNQYGNQYD